MGAVNITVCKMPALIMMLVPAETIRIYMPIITGTRTEDIKKIVFKEIFVGF
jgi:hypothetical protein